MTVNKIRFDSMEDIGHFINEVERWPFDMDVRCGNQIVDARSFMGVAAMGIHRELDLCAHVQELKPDFYSKFAFCMK